METNNSSKFDFDAHARAAVEEYQLLQPVYFKFAEKIRDILFDAIPKECSIHSIQARAKELTSFGRKACKPHKEDPTSPRYPNPLVDLTDLSGVRVITFVPNDLKEVEACIRSEFDVEWHQDVGEVRFLEGRFGYKSIHFLIKLRDDRFDLSEYLRFKGLIAEIQIRTVMQHAWAEIEHDIRYKASQIPTELEQRFNALAGMLEIADREFQAIQDEDAQYRARIEISMQDELVQTQIDISAESPSEAISDLDEADSHDDEEDVGLGLPEIDPEEMEPTPSLARTLITLKRFAEATQVYSRMILLHPHITTLYSGRAKARFLAGDRALAIEDIEYVLSKLPRDPGATYLKELIEKGPIRQPKQYPNQTLDMSWKGQEFLREGKGEDAFQAYSAAQAKGTNFFFSQINKAMACILIKDSEGADYFLDQLRLYAETTPTLINVTALRGLCACLRKKGVASARNRLADQLTDCPEYRYDKSPLLDLETGLLKRDGLISDCIAQFFEILREFRGDSDPVEDWDNNA